jgi:hypothetical protein
MMGGKGNDTFTLNASNLTTIANQMEGSRIESVEKIDLATDTAANTLKIKVSDALDMSGMNVFNDTTLGGTTLGATVAKHQVLVDAAAGDIVQIDTTGWTTSSNVVANGHTYDIYNYGPSAAQLLIDHNATVQQVL